MITFYRFYLRKRAFSFHIGKHLMWCASFNLKSLQSDENIENRHRESTKRKRSRRGDPE